MTTVSSCRMLISLLLMLFTGIVNAEPPRQADVDTYASLCKIGTPTTFNLSAELGMISRRLLSGKAELTGSMHDEFPGLKNDQAKLLAFEAYRDCMYRYVERFHSSPGKPSNDSTIVGPAVPAERRREIVFLANELEHFKDRMSKFVVAVPATYYDKRDSTEKRLREDPRLVGIADYSRYKVFQSASGGLDFSNATNSDLTLLCTTFSEEARVYRQFIGDYRPLNYPSYDTSREVDRICSAARKGR